MTNGTLQEFTTEQLLAELDRRDVWYYTWTTDTFKCDLEGGPLDTTHLTDRECLLLAQYMYEHIDSNFASWASGMLDEMRNP